MRTLSLLVIGPREHYALRGLAALDDVALVQYSEAPAEIAALATAAEVILWTGLCAGDLPPDALWRRATGVRWMHSLSAGVERLLTPALVDSSIVLTNARGVFRRALAEFAVLGVLFHLKKARRLLDNQLAHRWDDFYVQSAAGRVVAVVGYGAIGRECALLCKALGMRIHAIRRNPAKSAADDLVDRLFAPPELHDMLAGADFVVCAAPLTSATRHLIGAAEFARMKSSAVVINVGRGPVIDESALVRALQEGRVAGAALDVFEREPLPASSPLWDLPNVLLSPHCTDCTENPDWLELSVQCFLDNFARYRAGAPLENVVDKSAGY